MSTVTVDGRQVAEYFAKEVQRIAVPSRRVRPDIGDVQVDMFKQTHGATKEHHFVRLKFDVEGNRGVELNVRLDQFAADPAGYARDILGQLAPILRDTMRLRERRKQTDQIVYDYLTQGAANG